MVSLISSLYVAFCPNGELEKEPLLYYDFTEQLIIKTKLKVWKNTNLIYINSKVQMLKWRNKLTLPEIHCIAAFPPPSPPFKEPQPVKIPFSQFHKF